MVRRIILAALALSSAALAAEEVEIAGFSATVLGEKDMLVQPQSVGVLKREELQRNEGVFLDDTLNLVPGVRFESRTVAGGQRITIRGYGNNTNFNGTGIKAYIDGIPLTDAEGTTILDDVDVSTLGRVEVIKGPASSLYGQGIGGVVRFSTLRPEPGTSRLSQDVTFGSQSLLRSNSRYEFGSDSSSVVVNYGHQHSDGYRVHSLSNKDYLLFSADYRPSSRQSITTYASYNHSFDQLAGQLTEDQYLANQDYAEPPYLANNGHVAIDSARVGIAHHYEFARWLSNTTSAYASGYQLNQPFAVGLSNNLALNGGGRTEFSLRVAGVRAALGSEIQDTISFKKSYGLANAVQGALRGDLQLRSIQSNTFAQVEVPLPADFTVTAGASLNVVRYTITDLLLTPGHLNGSGLKSFDPVITPRVAVEKSFAQDLVAYAQVSQGYSPPGSGSVVIPQIGAVNKDLAPERGTLLEVGSKGRVFDGRLSYEAALFELMVSDKLTSRAVTDPASGSTLYSVTANSGNQNNRGLELSGSYALVKDGEGVVPSLRVFAAYTFSSFRYDNFKSDANNDAKTINYDGNKVVGVPEHAFDAGFDLDTRWGLYLNGTFRHLSAVQLTYDNRHSAKGYSLLDGKLGYRVRLPEKFALDAAVGSRNLTGSTWYTMVFLNGNYAGAPPNVYLPGPSSPTVYGSVNLSKSF